MTTSAVGQVFPQELVREFVIAAHGDLTKVKMMLAENPGLLTVEYDWNSELANFFLAERVPLNICVAAMLGRLEDVNRFLEDDPSLANARGAHGISVMFHAAMCGDVQIPQSLRDHGCKEGFSHAIHGAINFKDKEMVAWLLANGATAMNTLDYQNKTLLTRAIETDQAEIVELLRRYGARETDWSHGISSNLLVHFEDQYHSPDYLCESSDPFRLYRLRLALAMGWRASACQLCVNANKNVPGGHL
jgi:uncharacterized protein